MTDSIQTYAETQFSLSSCVLEKGTVKSERYRTAFDRQFMRYFLRHAYQYSFGAAIHQMDHYLEYATITSIFNDTGTELVYVFGPILKNTMSPITHGNYISKYQIPAARKTDFAAYLDGLPTETGQNVADMVLTLYSLLNNAVTAADSILRYGLENTRGKRIRQRIDSVRQATDGIADGLELYNEYQAICLELIQQGNPDRLLLFFKERSIPLYQMSSNSDNNVRTIATIAIAFSMEAAVKGGLNYSIALSQTRLYLSQMEQHSDIDDILSLISACMIDFARRVEQTKLPDGASFVVRRAIGYIHSHIYEKLTVEQVAEVCGINGGYLSRLFLRDVGQPLKAYILTEKIEEAKRLLRNTDIPLWDIAERLAFSSQSHFQKCFKNITGVTPQSYRAAADPKT